MQDVNDNRNMKCLSINIMALLNELGFSYLWAAYGELGRVPSAIVKRKVRILKFWFKFVYQIIIPFFL